MYKRQANELFEDFMERARRLAPTFTRRSFTKLSREAITAFDLSLIHI